MRMSLSFNGWLRHVSQLTVPFCLMLLLAAVGNYATGKTWSNTGPEGGNVRAMAVDPQNPATVYVATGNGIFKSIDYGDRWEPINSGLSRRPFYSIAIDPLNPATIYVGTVSGVYRSTNGGVDWSAADGGLTGQLVESLVIDPQNPAILYAGTFGSGVYKSTDGGVKWSEANNGLARTSINGLALSPQNPAILYAATQASGIYRSTDGGQNWSSANGIIPTSTILSIAVDPSNPDIVYAGTLVNGTYKSTDGANTWSRIDNGLPNYYSAYNLAIDPRDPENIYAAFMLDGVYRSTNGGKNWMPAFTGLPYSDVQTEIAINPKNPDIVYAGTTFDGVFRSMNAGVSWNPVNSGLVAATISALAISRQGPVTVYAGTFDKGYKSGDGGHSWSILGGDRSVYSLAVDPTDPSTLYVGSNDGVYKRVNGGADWNFILSTKKPLIDPNIPAESSPVIALAIDPINPAILYAGSGEYGAFKSINGGTNWSFIGLEGIEIRCFAINPDYSATIYAATSSGVFKSTDGGTNWSSMNTGMLATDIRALAINPMEPETVYVGTDYGGIYKSTDGGANWNSANTGLAGSSARSLAIDPADPNTLYAGTYYGVFKSTDGGKFWRILGHGPTFANIGSLVIDPIMSNKIYAGTAGNGIWVYSPEGSSLDPVISSGGVSVASTTGDGSIRTGYASLSVSSGSAPYATAVFSLKQNGVTISEAGVPGSPPTTAARIFIDYRNNILAIPGRSDSGTVNINTGVSIVNYGSAPTNVTYTLRDFNGDPLAVGHDTMYPGEYLAGFVNQLRELADPYFKFPSDFQDTVQFGSLDITSDQPLSVVGLRGTNNQRNDFLLTTTPIADLTKPRGNTPIYFPQFVDGGGNTTSLLLLNTSDETETGTLQIRDKDGNPFVVTPVGLAADSIFPYSIPPHGVLHFQTDGLPTNTKAGWAQLTPDAGTSTPVASGVFAYNPSDVLVSESGIPSAAATTQARIYVDLSGGHNTGLAIANIVDADASITLNAFEMDGITQAGVSPEPIQMAANGYTAAFADQFISGLPEGFKGVLDIRSTTPFAALTLRSLLNERHDFLMTTFPIADANQSAPSPIVFPQIADGGGYVTQFILLSPNGESISTLSLFDESGMPFDF